MFAFSELNPWAVLVATVVGFLLGGLWYGPLFGKAWMRAIGKKEEDLGSPATAMSLSFVAQVVSAVALGLLVVALDLESAGEGIALGALIGIGFIATALGSDMAFGGARVSLWAIQSGYRVAYMILMGLILALWR